MNLRNPVMLTALFALAPLLACSDGPTDPGHQVVELPRNLTLAEQEIIDLSNGFGLDLLTVVDRQREAPGANTILSPLSASMALGMALEGAEGETFAEMRDMLGFQGLGREEINASYQGIMDLLLELDPKVEVGVANSAWAHEGFPVEPSYFDALASYFDAEIRTLDFSASGAKETINGWVADETNDRIQEIVDEIQPGDVLFLINALYFQGDWTTKFDPDDTAPAPFRRPDGSTVTVDMMGAEVAGATYGRVEGGRSVVELPYGGEAFAMAMVLPGEKETLDDLLEDLDQATWDGWMDALAGDDIRVEMPKFELTWDGRLDPPLKELGMVRAFHPDLADFSRISPTPSLYVTKVRQSTFLKVNEKGTEAAAATSVGMGLVSAPPSFRADRPFLLAIRERLSGTILFLGAIRDPLAAG